MGSDVAPRLFNRNPARLDLLGFGQGQRQNAILHLGLDLFLIDPTRLQTKAPTVVPHVILRVDRLQLLVLGEVDATSNAEHVILEMDFEIRFVDTGHLHYDR